MLKYIALLIVIALAALLGYASTKPDIFEVRRSIQIQASPSQVHALINDLRHFNTWNPFNAKDPGIQLTYRGPGSGPGAAFDFKGNKEVGEGTVAITASTPSQIDMTLDMSSPMACHNLIDFTLTPQGGGTQVTWAMRGPSPLLAKVMQVVFDMDKMVGGDFESGLSRLKSLAEQPPSH